MKKILLLLTALFLFSASRATHFRGIEMYATHLSGKTYKLYINLYTKASSPASTVSIQVGWDDGTADTLQLDTASGSTDPITDTRTYNLELIHTYSADGFYTPTTTVPNWEASILNITDAVNTPFTGYIEIVVGPLTGYNHFDGYQYHQTDGVQSGNNYYLDLSWSEPDGDSVVIEQQPASELTLGVNYYYPAPSWGGSEYIWDKVYHFDNIATQGYYAVSFRTKEYRVGNLIASQLREFCFIYNATITGVDERNPDQFLEIFPNPCNNTVYIHTPQSQLFSVYDLHGKTLLSATTNQSLDIAVLQPGMYLIKTKNGSVCRLIKE
jgi:hypothetical protein